MGCISSKMTSKHKAALKGAVLGAVEKAKDSQKLTSKDPKDEDPKPMAFAVMRMTHEAFRGCFKDLLAETADLDKLRAEWAAFVQAEQVHQFMEDSGFFPLLDAKFEGAVKNAEFGPGNALDHKKIHAIADAVTAALTTDIAAAQVAIKAFTESYELHMQAEEKVMMPLTMKTGATPAEREFILCIFSFFCPSYTHS
jgi:hypothetical protein